MKKSDEIKRQMQARIDETTALQNLAEKEERELSDDEQSRWDAIMARAENEDGSLNVEKSGELTQLKAALDRALKYEDEVRRAREARAALSNAPQQEFDRNGTPGATPDIPSNVRLMTPTMRAFTGNGDKTQAQRDAFDCGLWLKSKLLQYTDNHEESVRARDKLIARRGADWLATQNETAPGKGGYLVPPQFENAVIVYREQVGVARRLARVVPMTSDNWTGVKQSSGTSVTYPGEEGAITASDLDFEQYTLTAKKRAILAYVSNELREDALPSIMDLLAMDMGHQFALQEDNEFINGDGTSTYGGVQGCKPAVTAATASVYTAPSGDDTWPELAIDDFYGTMAKIADKYRSMPLSWVCSGPFKWIVMDRLAVNNNGAVSMDIVDGQPRPMFLGYPVVLTDRMPTATAVSTVSALFGAFSNAAVLGDRSGIQIATSEHYKFNTDQIAVRATTRYDIHVHEEGDTSTAGAIAGLKTAAS